MRAALLQPEFCLPAELYKEQKIPNMIYSQNLTFHVLKLRINCVTCGNAHNAIVYKVFIKVSVKCKVRTYINLRYLEHCDRSETRNSMNLRCGDAEMCDYTFIMDSFLINKSEIV